MNQLPPLELLKAFVIFAESRNLVEAAKRLGISQPALSLQMQRLEVLMPLPLFGNEGKRKILTHYGRSVCEAAKAELERLSYTLNRVNLRYAKAENLEIRVGARREVFHRVSRQLRFPGRIRFVALTNPQAINELLDHRIDIAISHVKPDHSEILSKKLFSNIAELAIHHKLLTRHFKGEKLTSALIRRREFLCEVPTLAYRADAPFLSEWLHHCELELRDVKLKYICDDWSILMKLVESGEGYCILPEDMDTHHPEIESVRIPAQVIPEVTYYALYHRELRKIPAFKDFLGN
jgi:DNA-binding transcriptional LysR family regulator